MKFLCDEMFKRFGRWLRAAGYDTGIVDEKASDRVILNQAIREGRLLLTADQKLLEIKNSFTHVILLKPLSIDETSYELSSKISIDWLKAPFSRCLICNHQLSVAPHNKISALPIRIRERRKEYRFCETCDRVFWHGTHVDQMLKRLQQWQSRRDFSK